MAMGDREREEKRVAAATMKILDSVDAVKKNGHFVFVNGDHSDTYVNKDNVLQCPVAVRLIAEMMADPFKGYAQVVVGPAIGGAILASHVAAALAPGTNLAKYDVFSAYPEKDPRTNDLVFRRGYDTLVHASRVIVVEDTLTTGDSVKKTIHAVKKAGGIMIGVAAIWNRGDATAYSLGVNKLHALISTKIPSWKPSECPMCAAKEPVCMEVGHGREFLASLTDAST